MKSKKHFWQVVGIAALLPAVFAVLDLIGAAMWKSLGGFGAEAYVIAEPTYMKLFWTFAYLTIFAIAGTYYFTTKDKSEALALGIIPFILLQMGAEDVFFYFMGGHDLWNATLPWLTNNLQVPTLISNALGQPIITGPIILLTAALGYGISYLVARQLVKIKG